MSNRFSRARRSAISAYLHRHGRGTSKLIPKLKGPDPVNMQDSYERPFGRNTPETGYESWTYETLQEAPTPPTTPSNETSAVHLFQMGNFHALFTADVGPRDCLMPRSTPKSMVCAGPQTSSRSRIRAAGTT
jgi:hypothetical protein